MAINSVSNAGTTTTTNNLTTTSSTDEAQSRFMKLLIAQMKNQDPLNPMDNAQMTTQISQINMVSGINKLNETLSSIAGSVKNNDSMKAASLLGHTVLVPGNRLQLTQGNAEMGMELSQGVDDLKVTILNSGGNVVHTMDLGPQTAGVQSLLWDGETDSGSVANDGVYSFQIEAVQDGKTITVPGLSLGKVDNVSLSGGVAKLNSTNLGDFGLSDIREIR